MRRTYRKRPRNRGLVVVGRLCLKMKRLCIFEMATCLCIWPFLVCSSMRRRFGKRPRIRGLVFVGRICLINENVMCIWFGHLSLDCLLVDEHKSVV